MDTVDLKFEQRERSVVVGSSDEDFDGDFEPFENRFDGRFSVKIEDSATDRRAFIALSSERGEEVFGRDRRSARGIDQTMCRREEDFHDDSRSSLEPVPIAEIDFIGTDFLE